MTDMAAIARLHAELPRQGPGSADDVRWALDQLGVTGPVRVVDAGCGPGADLETLSDLLPEAQIRGIDAFPHLAEEARQRLAGRPNVTVETGDMSRIDGPVDLIWCAGALYFLGVTEGLRGWREALAPGGAVAFSEPVWPEGPREVAAEFWAEYPAIADMEGIEARVSAAGYRTLASRRIVGDPWAAYMGPLETRVGKLRGTGEDGLDEVLIAAEQEVALWRQAPDQIQYALMLARPA